MAALCWQFLSSKNCQEGGWALPVLWLGLRSETFIRPLVELCVEPAGLCGRCMRGSVPLRVVPSSTGLPSKRCPDIRFLSIAEQEIGVFQQSPCPCDRPLLTRTSTGNTQTQFWFSLCGVSGPWCTQGLFEGLLFLHGLESNPGSSLQTEEEAGLP